MMKATRVCLWLHALSTVAVLAGAFDPITTTVVFGVGAALSRTIYNYLRESCNPNWIAFNATGETHAVLFMNSAQSAAYNTSVVLAR